MLRAGCGAIRPALPGALPARHHFKIPSSPRREGGREADRLSSLGLKREGSLLAVASDQAGSSENIFEMWRLKEESKGFSWA